MHNTEIGRGLDARVIAGLGGVVLAAVAFWALMNWQNPPVLVESRPSQPAPATKPIATTEISLPQPPKTKAIEMAGGRGFPFEGEDHANPAALKTGTFMGNEHPGKTKGVASGGIGGPRSVASPEGSSRAETDRLQQALADAQAELAQAQDRWHQAGAEKQRAQGQLAIVKARRDAAQRAIDARSNGLIAVLRIFHSDLEREEAESLTRVMEAVRSLHADLTADVKQAEAVLSIATEACAQAERQTLKAEAKVATLRDLLGRGSSVDGEVKRSLNQFEDTLRALIEVIEP